MNQFNNHPLNRKYNIDSAMNSLWEFYKNRFLYLFILSLVMSLIMQYVSTLINLNDIQSVTDPMVALEKLKPIIVPIILIFVLNLFFTTILQYYILYNPVDSGITIFTSIIRSLKYFIPYLIIMILLAFAGGIALLLGLFAFIIGAFFVALYIMTLYLFILPVMMVENVNIADTIVNSFKLLHRNFWSNIGWATVILIGVIITSVILSSLILIPFTGSFLKSIFSTDKATVMVDIAKNPIFIFLSAVVNALIFPVMPIFAGILYFNGKSGENKVTIIPPEADPENGKPRVEDLYAKPYSDDHPDNPDKVQ